MLIIQINKKNLKNPDMSGFFKKIKKIRIMKEMFEFIKITKPTYNVYKTTEGVTLHKLKKNSTSDEYNSVCGSYRLTIHNNPKYGDIVIKEVFNEDRSKSIYKIIDGISGVNTSGVYTYDVNGNKITDKDSNGKLLYEYTYDSNGKMMTINSEYCLNASDDIKLTFSDFENALKAEKNKRPI